MGQFWSSLVGKGGASSTVSLHVNTGSGRKDYNISSTVKQNVERDESGLKISKPKTDEYVQKYSFDIGKGKSKAKLVAFDPANYTGGDDKNRVTRSYDKNAAADSQAPCFISKEDKDALVKDKNTQSAAILKYSEGDDAKYVLLPSEIDAEGKLTVMGQKVATVKKQQESITAVKLDPGTGISEISKGASR